MALTEDVATALTPWLRRVDSVAPLGGGWNSSTWLVAADDRHYVAKLVDHLDTVVMPPQVSAAARRAWQLAEAAVAAGGLTISLIHADPGPDSFLLSEAGPGPDALIDWATPLRGPLLYDLASFAVLTGAAAAQAARWFIAGYASEMPEIGPQLAHLDCFVKVRWAVQAIYFASRIERGIDRGPGAPDVNQDGLAAAYAGMTAGSARHGLCHGT